MFGSETLHCPLSHQKSATINVLLIFVHNKPTTSVPLDIPVVTGFAERTEVNLAEHSKKKYI